MKNGITAGSRATMAHRSCHVRTKELCPNRKGDKYLAKHSLRSIIHRLAHPLSSAKRTPSTNRYVTSSSICMSVRPSHITPTRRKCVKISKRSTNVISWKINFVKHLANLEIEVVAFPGSCNYFLLLSSIASGPYLKPRMCNWRGTKIWRNPKWIFHRNRVRSYLRITSRW